MAKANPRYTRWLRDLLDYAAEIGIEKPVIIYGGKHPSIVGKYKGREFRRSVANTPSDAIHARIKAQSDLKRECRRLEAAESSR